ncbi:MAG TPA: YiiX family permuted papain-like enzyme [Ignavibacteria bacterium]|nr:YiiX family permuted papain-like enzyme [Ignavibacteria bacterium]
MKKWKYIIITVVILFLLGAGYYLKRKYYDPKTRLNNANEEITALVDQNNIKEGDIIFQSLNSKQCQAIKDATKSKYTHCGIIFKNGNEFLVYEAVQPVKITPLNKWIARGNDEHYVIKRLNNASEVLNSEIVKNMKSEAESFVGKNYDIYFGWSDDKIYCSELVWKIYKDAANIEVGKLKKLKDFDLSGDEVKRIMSERYGSNIPYNEDVISPADIYDSELLYTVKSN